MQTIKNNVNNEIIIKNSKFICYLYKIKSIEDINKILSNLKEKYKDATHHCYAYILDNLKKSSDDGEPGGTAGIPILKVLENNNLTNILAVVIRYFGGIKLGAGGLVRAYTKSITTTLKEDNITNLIEGYNIDIEFNYNQIKEIDYLLKDITINSKLFDNTIIYNIDIPTNFLETINSNKINYNLIKEIFIETDHLSNK
jgi:uncharacterized YigZ family protein